MMRKLLSYALLFIMVATSFSPLSNASIEQLPYIDATAGKYYAIGVGGQPYRAFYIDNGQIIYVDTYKWAANKDYIIFKAPCSCRIYLRYEPSFSPPIFSTIDITAPAIEYNATVTRSKSVTFQVKIDDDSNSYSYYFRFSKTVTVSNWSVTHVVSESYSSGVYKAYAEALSEPVVVSGTGHSYLNTPWSIKTNAYIEDWLINASSNCGTVVSKNKVFTRYGLYQDSYYVTRSSNGDTVKFTRQTKIQSCTSDIPTVTINVTLRARDTVTVSYNKTWLAERGIIVYDSINELQTDNIILSQGEASFYLYSASLSMDAGNTTNITIEGLVIPINASVEVTKPVISVNGIYVSAVYSEGILLAKLPPMQPPISGDVIANYPFAVVIEPPSIDKVTADTLVSKVPLVNGSIIGGLGEGILKLGVISGSTILWDGMFNISAGYDIAVAHYTINNKTYTIIYVQTPYAWANATWTGKGWIVYDFKPTIADLNISISDFKLKEYKLSQLSYIVIGATATGGSWQYRLPIYISLSYLPSSMSDSGYVFRLELPVGDWIRAGLLSPGLEDLMIVDAAMQPLPLAIVKNDGERAVVYVKYTHPLYSQTLVIYVLLQNKELWGTGKTFSNPGAVFSMLRPEGTNYIGLKYAYTYLAYNGFLILGNATIGAGKTPSDLAIVVPSQGLYREVHGTLVTSEATVEPIAGSENLIVFVDDFRDMLIYVDGHPWRSVDLNENVSPAYYIAWDGTETIYAFKTIPYSYAVGSLQGGLERPEIIVKSPGAAPHEERRASAWDVFVAMLPLLLMGVFIRLVQNPPAPPPRY